MISSFTNKKVARINKGSLFYLFEKALLISTMEINHIVNSVVAQLLRLF